MSFKDQFNRFFAIEDEGDDQAYAEQHNHYSQEDDQQNQTVKKAKTQQVKLSQNQSNPAKTSRPAKQASQADIKVIEPRIYSEVQQIADLLINGKIVLVHFHKAEEDQAQKMIDFLGGTIYAIEGDMQRVSDTMFICAPASVNVDGISDSLLNRDRI